MRRETGGSDRTHGRRESTRALEGHTLQSRSSVNGLDDAYAMCIRRALELYKEDTDYPSQGANAFN